MRTIKSATLFVALLTFLLLPTGALAPLTGHQTTATADVIWEDGVPIFRKKRRSRPSPTQFKQQRQNLGAWSIGGSHTARRTRRRRYNPRPKIAPKAPVKARLAHGEEPGTVVIDHTARKLYFALSEQELYVYPISVGREGFAWTGEETVSRLADWPGWRPPAEMRRRDRSLPVYMNGGLRNPLGAKAIYLGKTLYRIHGTNAPSSIGRAASSGCFRMLNENVVHLASLIEIGATVKVLKSWDGTKDVSAALAAGVPIPVQKTALLRAPR